MSEVERTIICDECGEEISKDSMTIGESQVDVFSSSLTKWNCKCGVTYWIGDIDSVHVKDL